jgi:hypothetical protein
LSGACRIESRAASRRPGSIEEEETCFIAHSAAAPILADA